MSKVRIYISFDDTDNLDSDYGTGKVARRFERLMPEGCRLWGVLRQQLLVDERIPYTSHNSSACLVVDAEDLSLKEYLLEAAVGHLRSQALSGSDPGLCVACEGEASLLALMEFGRRCTAQIVTQGEAMKAASGSHLSGHGGTNDGIIGAAAAVGLTASGWNGRFIEFGGLRDFPHEVSVANLEQAGISVVSLDRDAIVPDVADIVVTNGWLRPRLLGFRPVLLVNPGGKGRWVSIGGKRNKDKGKKEV